MMLIHRNQESLFQRCSQNPILTADDWPYPANAVFNPGAIRLPDGSTLLLARVEDHSGFSHLCVARSPNGVDGWQIDPQPSLVPDSQDYPEELWGIEDPRITYVPELDKYAIAYVSYSRNGPGVSLALTENFHDFKRYGLLMLPDDKDAAFFPRRFQGQWAIIHRPLTSSQSNIWISYSHDLQHWGEHRVMLEAHAGGWWDANKIGLSGPPIETAEGWLILYHGVHETASGSLYRLGLALFDLEHPQQLLLRGNQWILGPQQSYERQGNVPNVVFPCGYTLEDDGDTINLYYGGADTCIALATASLHELLDWLHRRSST